MPSSPSLSSVGGGDVGVDADGVHPVGLAEAVTGAGVGEPGVDVGVDLSDGGGVEVLVVDEQDVVVRVPAVLIAPGELQGDDVPGDPEPALEPLPRGTLGDSLPGVPLRAYIAKNGDWTRPRK